MQKCKRWAVALALVCALACLVACDKTEGFRVSLQYDASQGSVTLSAPAYGERYVLGETVTVTVTPAEGYAVESLFVAGHNGAALIDGSYSFAITADTVVGVNFRALERYTVTLTTDEGADATLDPASDDGTYYEGTALTLTVTPKEGRKVARVTLGGTEVFPTDNVYAFSVTADTEIDVTTARTIPQSVLDSLRGNLLFEGTIRQEYTDGDVMSSVIHTLYDATQGLVEQYEILDEDSDNYYDYLLVGAGRGDGYAYTPYHDLDGRVQWILPTDEDGYARELEFATLANPFETLTANDFAAVDDTTYTLDPSRATAAAYALTGYQYGIASFSIETADGKAVRVLYRSQQQSMSGFSFSDNVSLTVTQGATLPAELTTDYPAQPALQTALERAAAATSYRAQHRETGAAAENYDIFRTQTAVWLENGEESFGYAERPDGNAWAYRIEDGKTVIAADEPAADSLDLAAASFVPSDISTAMFAADADGKTYRLRRADLEGPLGSVLVRYCALAFATGGPEQSLFYNYATDLAITLSDDGALSVVEVSYPSVEDNKLVICTATLTFSDFGTATLPENAAPDDDALAGTFPIAFLGTWIDDATGMRADVTLDAIVLDGMRSQSAEKSGDGCTAVIGGKTYAVRTENGQLVLTEGETAYRLRKRTCAWEDLLGRYDGTNGANTMTLNVTENGIVLLLNGVQGTLRADYFTFDESDGTPTISFVYSDETYGRLPATITMLAKQAAVNFFVGDDDGYLFNINLYASDYDFRAWDAFVGTYRDGETELTVEKSRITLVYEGETLHFEGEDILFEAVEYPVPIFTLTHGTTEYTLQQYGSTPYKLGLYVAEQGATEATRAAILVRDGYTPISWDEYVGKWVGIGTDGEGYGAQIDADDISITIEGTTHTASDIDFDRYLMFDLYGNGYWLSRFDFAANGKRYLLRQYEAGERHILQLFEDNGTTNLPLCLLGIDEESQLEDWSAFEGTYTWGEYSVTVSADGLAVTLDGTETDVSVTKFYSNHDYTTGETFYSFDFSADGAAYTLRFADGAAILTADGLQLLLPSDGYTPPSVSADWIGYYAIDDQSIKIKITDTEVTFAVDGGALAPATVVYFDANVGMTIAVGDTQYFFSLYIALSPQIETDSITVTHNGTTLGVAKETNEPEDESELMQFAGTWSGSSSDTIYTVVIGADGSITLSIDGGTAKQAIAITISYDKGWNMYVVKFTVGDTVYTFEIYDAGSGSLSNVNANMRKQS